MSSPNSCLRCSRPLVTNSDLCDRCQFAISTSQSSGGTVGILKPDLSAVPPTNTANFEAPTASVSSVVSCELSGRKLPLGPPGYEIVKWLGGGGMGEVYLARELTSERHVAMKFLRCPADAVALDRFLLELRILARVDHPNVIRVLASDFLRADPYFTMEYMPGGSLNSYLTMHHPLPLSEVLRLIRQVAAGVVALHAEKIIHRDLKPSNVLLAADGTPKVADTGLAKLLDASHGLTATTGVLGTTPYMPPEQVSRRNGEPGPWSDVYGLGATLYHLLIGQPPFTGDSSEEVIQRLLNELPKRIRVLRPEVPAALEGIVFKCLEKDPKDRYQAVSEFIADLDRYEVGEKPTAPLLTRRRRLKLWAEHNRHKLLAGVTLLVLVVSAFVLGAAFQPAPVPPLATDRPAAVDPIAEIHAALAAGQTVELIGQKGLPRWHEWRLSPSLLTEAGSPDAACTFQANKSTILVLLPNPGVDRYRFAVELKQLGTHVPGSVQIDHVGVMFGCDTRALPNNQRLTTVVGATYFDIDRIGSVSPNFLRVEGACILETPHQLPRQATSWPTTGNLGPTPLTFKAPITFPGPWRQFIVDVTPDLVRIWWRENLADEPTILYEWTGDQIRDWYAHFATMAEELEPRLKPVDPLRWHPQMALGVWAYQASVAIRNAVIGPIPP